MKLSNYFLPTLKENPVDAKIASHQLMIRAGMIRQNSSGIYTWLPLGLKVLRKVERIIREEMNKAGALEISMPTIQSAELWQESNRYDSYGKEMLKMKDRHNRDILYGPTHEEVITDIFRKNVSSYKDLPKNFYQINLKFRDEIRPRFGVMRAREFMMKDGYSFDIDEASAKRTYDLMFETYFNIFNKIGLDIIAVKADNGAIGGDMSHEFHILAKTGESEIFFDKKLEEYIANKDIVNIKKIYSAADDMHDPNNCPIPQDQITSKRGIEVAHIFNFGTKYTQSMKGGVMSQEGNGKVYPYMGSYGIGVSRVVAAAIEASHNEKGIIWPEAIAPFDVYLINVKTGDESCDKFCEEIYQKLTSQGKEILYDDRKVSLGQKFSTADLVGIPTQMIVGPKLAAKQELEVKLRSESEKKVININDIS
ncbi:MAG: proline--tRNA ligase [Rickettsiales bacterium]|nr:proline--tRNA ligase [Rickettsiales bacterium]